MNITLPFRSEGTLSNGFAPREGFCPFELEHAESTLALRFQQSALRHAERTALVNGAARRTYGELGDLTRDIGGRLRARFPEGGLIALVMPYGLDLVEALLGTLCGGFACLPVDMALPDAELQRLVAAACPVALIAARGDDARAGAIAGGVPVVALASLCSGASPSRVWEPAGAGRLAGSTVMVYATSGSTGIPKLVGLSNRAILFDIGRQTNDLFLGPQDRFDQLFSFAFSASLAPLFGSLLNGGSLHLFEARSRLELLREWLSTSRITVSTMSASMLRAVCDPATPASWFPDLRLISTGGEALLPRDVERFRAAFPPATVLQNAMASTETRTYAQYFVPRAGDVVNSVPIGWPVYGKDIVLLGEDGQPVADGAAGEVVVRSRYHASGYLNDPQLTAERFQMAAGCEGEVLYRTGDFARRRADGCLLFAGRADSMVKLGGYRIELEAVAAGVRRCPGISEAVAILREDIAGYPRIVAYYVGQVEAAALRESLAAELPEYMVPAELAAVAEMPRLLNGKLDRSRLPVPRRASDHPAKQDLPPCDRIEAELSAIWRDLIGRPVGVRDAFLDSGGGSLLALALLERIERQFGVHLALAALLQAPTIETLAGVIRGPQSAKMPRLAEVQPNGDRFPIFWVHAELRFRAVARNLGLDQPLLGLQLGEAGRLDTIPAMAEYHIQTIRQRQAHGPYHIAGYCAAGLVAYEVARQLLAAGEEVALLALIDTHGPVREQRRPGPKSRLTRLLQSGGSRWVLLSARARDFRRTRERAVWSWLYRHGLPFEQRLRERIRGSAPEEFLPVIAAARQYTPPVYPGRLTLFRGPSWEAVATVDPQFGWAGMALGGLELIEVPAGHLDVPVDPIVAAELRRRVSERAERRLRSA